MRHDAHPAARQLAWRASPADVIARWPTGEPLAALVTGDAGAGAGWSILARPVREIAGDPFDALAVARVASDAPVPFAGGVIGWLSYDLGRDLEPSAQAPADGARDDRAWPRACLLGCPGAYVYDHARARWWAAGAADGLPRIDLDVPAAPRVVRVGGLKSATGRAAYERAAAEVVERIGAGEIFQANIAHRLSASFRGSPRELFARVLRAARPRYGALIEGMSPGRAVVSMSPELLVELDPASRRVVTRPIKGTRPAGGARDLAASAKDAAELAMIVDLMRNDLGRVREIGSVRVDEARAIEPHGAAPRARGLLHHGVATVSGTLRAAFTAADLMRAVFPGGSVTGAPKIRAMRVIDELEPVRRGPYCGAIGFASATGHASWSIAIRTALVTASQPAPSFDALDGVIDYSVGAGIVADSSPSAEWRETLAKAATFRAVASAARAKAEKKPKKKATA